MDKVIHPENETLVGALVTMMIGDIAERAGPAGVTVAEIADGLYALGEDDHLPWSLERVELTIGLQINIGFLVPVSERTKPARWRIADCHASTWRRRAEKNVYAIAKGGSGVGPSWLVDELSAPASSLPDRVLSVVAMAQRPITVSEVALLVGEADVALDVRAVRKALVEHQRNGAIMPKDGGWTLTPAFLGLLTGNALAAARA